MNSSLVCCTANHYHPLFVHKYRYHFCCGACHGHGIVVVYGTHGEKVFFLNDFLGCSLAILKQPKSQNTLNSLLYLKTAINTKLERTIVQLSPSQSLFC